MRDLDFHPVNAVPHLQSATTQPQLTPPPKKQRLSIWLVAIIVVGLAGALTFLLYRNDQPLAAETGQAAKIGTKVSVSGSQATAATVIVYDAGAGNAAVSQLVADLQQHNITTQNLGVSELQLDQTYIWYQAAYQTQAQTIASLLGSKKISLRPYNGTGPYDVLVQLGP